MPIADGNDGLPERLARLERRLEALEERVGVAADGAAGTAPDPAAAEPPGERELRVGAWWLSRLGIVALITGLALLVLYEFGRLGPLLRIVLGYGAGAALAGLGRWVSRRHRVFGDVLVGGGLAVGYFVTYALHFVPAVRVVDSAAVALPLVGGAIVAIVLVAHRMSSETVAGIALFLCLHTGLLSAVTSFTLLATSLLAAGAVFFLVSNRWVVVPGSGLVAAYATHARWVIGGADGGSHALSLGFLSVYFGLFAAAVLLRPRALDARSRVALPVANAAGLVLLGGWELRGVEGATFPFLAVVAAAHLALAAIARARAPEEPALVDVHAGVAIVAAALAAWTRLEPAPFGVFVAALALTSDLAARRRGAPALGWVAAAVLAAALARPPLLEPEAVRLAALGAAALAGGELLRARAARGSHVALLHGHAALAAVALLRLASALAPDGYGALAWTLAGAGLFGAGFLARARRYRVAGFVAFGAAGVRLLLLDLRRVDPHARIATFLAVGVLLLGVSFVYARRRGPAPPGRDGGAEAGRGGA